MSIIARQGIIVRLSIIAQFINARFMNAREVAVTIAELRTVRRSPRAIAGPSGTIELGGTVSAGRRRCTIIMQCDARMNARQCAITASRSIVILGPSTFPLVLIALDTGTFDSTTLQDTAIELARSLGLRPSAEAGDCRSR